MSGRPVMVRVLRAKTNIFLIIFILALAIRLWGIDHGFPYILHPDEPTLVVRALGLRYGNLNPQHFDWPHFQVYLCYLVFTLFIKVRIPLLLLGLKDFTNQLFPLLWDDTLVFYFIARLMTAFMGAATVAILYLAGKRLYSRSVGILAAVFLLSNTVHVSESHMATIDVPMTFWLGLSLLFSVNILRGGKFRDYLFAGLFAGFAASTKYNGALSVITIFVAFLIFSARVGLFSGKKNRAVFFDQFRNLIISAMAALMGFFIGTPYAFFDWPTFIRTDSPKGAFWQFEHVGGGSLRQGFFLKARDHLLITLPGAQGWLLHAVGLLGIILSILKKQGEDIFMIIFPTSYFLYVANFKYAPQHFFIPLYPYLSIIAARILDSIFKFLSSKFSFSPSLKILLFSLGVLVIISPSLLNSLRLDYLFTQKDTRILAKEWIEKNIEDGSNIALAGDYYPPLREKKGPEDADLGYYTIPLRHLLQGPRVPESLFPIFEKQNVSYVVMGDFNLDLELARIKWDPDEPNFLAWVKENGQVIKRFEPDGHLGPVVLIYRILH